MTQGEKFRAAAQKIVHKFGKELGYSTLHVIQEPQEDDYDETTGVLTPVYIDVPLYACTDEIAIGSIILGNRHIAMDPNYTRDSKLVYIAGLDVTAAPKEDDLFTPAGDTERYRIIDVASDMYGSAYLCQTSRWAES